LHVTLIQPLRYLLKQKSTRIPFVLYQPPNINFILPCVFMHHIHQLVVLVLELRQLTEHLLVTLFQASPRSKCAIALMGTLV
jgi:hypothetical protein